ncbi:MAG: PriCT-2 domain-containing protein, partial [Prevotellaceae bacterium]|nr:PriCT-2 domain-containing protein [Prevotellaceae bacterium]
MSKKTFNPKDWASPTSNNKPANAAAKPPVCTNPKTDIETITARIEAASVDIAPNYADWRDLGFALADALGESGRNYYHRLSRFYPKYNQTETDKQFYKCLKAHGHGVTIKTLYHLAKQAGIEISILPNIQNGNLAKVAKLKT